MPLLQAGSETGAEMGLRRLNLPKQGVAGMEQREVYLPLPTHALDRSDTMLPPRHSLSPRCTGIFFDA
jgi:hypothetical protein